MADDARVTVHFSCPHCLMIYRATQERTAENCPGEFYCGRCGTPVHEWIAPYCFSNWNPMSENTSNSSSLRWVWR
jgi:hypothetical protein